MRAGPGRAADPGPDVQTIFAARSRSSSGYPHCAGRLCILPGTRASKITRAVRIDNFQHRMSHALGTSGCPGGTPPSALAYRSGALCQLEAADNLAVEAEDYRRRRSIQSKVRPGTWLASTTNPLCLREQARVSALQEGFELALFAAIIASHVQVDGLCSEFADNEIAEWIGPYAPDPSRRYSQTAQRDRCIGLGPADPDLHRRSVLQRTDALACEKRHGLAHRHHARGAGVPGCHRASSCRSAAARRASSWRSPLLRPAFSGEPVRTVTRANSGTWPAALIPARSGC